ncbi:MAG TPA: hypothetical protein EYQ42_06110 [Thiotrichaceae bacterium]|nr:hypothetical protein [Thiotrichaceae bacterium]HIM08895.1 hypothetical protein [Gammaproteobacteria bacterium]
MKRIFYIVILLALTPGLVNAFGLGHLDLNSALNEPFDARIQLLSPTADELDSLKINLADNEAFTRAKVDRPFVLSKLKFALKRSVDDGPDYIRVFSQEPIREPFLNFLIEVSWSNGRLFREYTVLLDPPLYDPNERASKFTQILEDESSMKMEEIFIEDPDHKVVYADAYEEFAKSNSGSSSSSSAPTYTPNLNYTGGDYGPTTGSDTLWSMASTMRPDSSISVNQMMLALMRANPEAFFDQNINNLKRGQILRMPNESEMNTLSNTEALAEAKSQHGAWANIRDNLSGAVSERPEVTSVSETPVAEAEVEMPAEEVADVEPELKLVAADDIGEATEQVSNVDSGSGEELVLAQESIQVLTQENIDLKDRVQESEALLDDLKRLLSLKDDELAALQEQMATQAEAELAMAEAAEEEMMEEVEEEAAEEEMMEEVEEEAAEEVMEAEEEMMEEVEEEATEEVMEDEEEMMEVVETEPKSASGGIMGMVNQYIGLIKEFVLGNMMVAMAVAGILVVIIIVVILLKFRKEPAETLHIDAMTEEAFPDFDSGDMGDISAEVDDSEAVTVLPDSEIETAMPEESADFDLDTEEVDQDTTQFLSETPAAAVEEEAEDDEDPLQEVNTYLAFEQFDQAEEFVRNVINDNPDKPEYHTKLLEVFYTSGDKKSYEEAAKILHDMVGGEGEHWNMAVAMWQEMSPNRALFEAGDDDDDDDDVADNTGGFVDVTADDEAEGSADLDFDIGGSVEEPVAEATPASDEEEMLDVTASMDAEDLLDVTAAVGVGVQVDSEAETAAPTSADDILDISSTGSEDLLDVTAANLDLDLEEDLLDVTSATSAGTDSSDLLEIDIEPETEAEESDEIEFDVPADTHETVEFDLGNTKEEEVSLDSVEDDNALDFDMSSDEGETIEFEVSEPEVSEPDDAGFEIDLASPEEADDDEPIRLDIGDDESSDDAGEISLEFESEESTEDEVSLDLDMGDETGDIELDLSVEEEPDAALSMDFDLSLDESIDDDLEGTIEIPKSALSAAKLENDDEDDDSTVFVPRAAQPEEQSAEDEIATKLDLAKAYVELGDKDSAKTILDEVMADGNDEQRQQAEDLLGQV